MPGAAKGRGTVGMVQVYPNSRNVVPGEVTFSIDMRNISDAAVDEMDRQLRVFITRVQQESGLAVTLQKSAITRRRRSIRIASRPLPVRRRDSYPGAGIVSGAGHDAVYMSYLAPTGDDLYSCKDRISHNENRVRLSRARYRRRKRAAAGHAAVRAGGVTRRQDLPGWRDV